MIDIVIPYLHTEPVWDELRFTVRSIEKNFMPEHQIWLFGDKHPRLKLNYVPVERIKNKSFAKTFDSIRKMYAIVNNPDISEDFIYWYDDIVLLSKIDIAFFDEVYALQNLQKASRIENNNYKTVLWRTHDILKKNNLSLINCETHLPKLFNKTKMKLLLDKFTPGTLLINSLYMNYYKPGEFVYLNKEDKIKAGFYGRDDFYSFGNVINVSPVLNKKIFLSYDNAGLTVAVKNYIISRFKTKSKYE